MSENQQVRPVRKGGQAALRMALIRNIHGYVGLFIAPSVIFFAVTGGLQLFKLHEAEGGYTPPALVEKLGQLHKEQRFEMRPKRRPPTPVAAAAAADPDKAASATAAKPASPPDDEDAAEPWNIVAIRWLFLAVSVGLTASTGLGVWMAMQPHRRTRLTWAMLAVGTVLPVLLVLI